MSKLYHDLARWFHLVTGPDDYAEEAAFFSTLLRPVIGARPASLLELGSGGGNNALHMKRHFASVTLVDLSEEMLEVSRGLNPDCEHLQGDMRSVRLGREFDAVFIHDAIIYMTTLDDLRRAIETAYLHCKPGGMALFVPDHDRETFYEGTDHGGEDGEQASARYLEWTYDPDPTDTEYITDYVVIVREGDRIVRVEHDRHVLGLFARDEWLSLMRQTGFEAEVVIDSYDRPVFVGRKP